MSAPKTFIQNTYGMDSETQEASRKQRIKTVRTNKDEIRRNFELFVKEHRKAIDDLAKR